MPARPPMFVSGPTRRDVGLSPYGTLRNSWNLGLQNTKRSRRSAGSGSSASAGSVWVERVPSIDEAGAAAAQQSFYFLDSLADHPGRLARVKLALGLDDRLIGALKT